MQSKATGCCCILIDLFVNTCQEYVWSCLCYPTNYQTEQSTTCTVNSLSHHDKRHQQQHPPPPVWVTPSVSRLWATQLLVGWLVVHSATTTLHSLKAFVSRLGPLWRKYRLLSTNTGTERSLPSRTWRVRSFFWWYRKNRIRAMGLGGHNSAKGSPGIVSSWFKRTLCAHGSVPRETAIVRHSTTRLTYTQQTK